jgi:hypothetical protein
MEWAVLHLHTYLCELASAVATSVGLETVILCGFTFVKSVYCILSHLKFMGSVNR